jgi:ABC-type nitrate/sulfonate/bicarbonate transport system substrate-binding protein
MLRFRRLLKAIPRGAFPLLVLSIAVVTACAPATNMQSAAPKNVHFMGGYKPQANLPFVAAYVAQAQGYFAAQNLNVQISHSAGQGEHLKLVLQGSVDVTTGAADAVLGRRSDNLPITAFALFGQRGDIAYAVLDSSDIRSPRDFENHTVGFKVNPSPEYLALLKTTGVDRSKIQEVPVGFDPRLLAAGRVDVYPVFESNEPHTLQTLGVPTRLIKASDYGVPGLGLTYITRQSLIDDDPDVLERFLKATLRGTEWARANIDAATDIVMQYAPNEDREHQRNMLEVELSMADGPVSRANGLGWSTPEQWQALNDSLLEFGGLKESVPANTVFSDRIVRSVYKNGQLVWP